MAASMDSMFVAGYFPSESVPFRERLEALFFPTSAKPKEVAVPDFPLHGPNTVRFIAALANNQLGSEPGLVTDGDPRAIDLFNFNYTQHQKSVRPSIIDSLGAISLQDKAHATELLKVAALYHDIGKSVRRANHPAIGANILRSLDGRERQRLVDLLVHAGEREPHQDNRFSLIASVIQHHDKFGVVNTGEGGMPLFADILYFRSSSDPESIAGIKKNITSVMLANLSDIAAVCRDGADPGFRTRDQAIAIANQVRTARGKAPRTEAKALAELTDLCKSGVCLGLDRRRLEKVLGDWAKLIELVDDVKGSRVRLMHQLLKLEGNPSRAIERIRRIVEAAASVSGCGSLAESSFLSPTTVESVLVGTLGAYGLREFSELFATVAKMDYGLNFFRAIICASVRKELDPKYRVRGTDNHWQLSPDEQQLLEEMDATQRDALTEKIVTIVVKTLDRLLRRYNGVLGYSSAADPRRFGLQLRSLTDDASIRTVIIDLLCVQELRDPTALTWLADEVTFWSMD